MVIRGEFLRQGSGGVAEDQGAVPHALRTGALAEHQRHRVDLAGGSSDGIPAVTYSCQTVS